MSEHDAAQLANSLRSEARRLGFGLVGICPAISPPGFGRFEEWVDNSFAGEMKYLESRREAYSHPKYVLPEVRSIVMLGLDYNTAAIHNPRPGFGRVSRYAWGAADYHDIIFELLDSLVRWLTAQSPSCHARGIADTAPLLEREFAKLAGLGWQGKNTMMINPRGGSFYFLAGLLTDLELPADAAFQTDHCGTCRRCLDACPTKAFADPYVLDARKCISYLTIELRDAIPVELRGGIGDWLFGCDVCQDVCPWNRFAEPTARTEFQAKTVEGTEELLPLFGLDDAEFRKRFRATPLWRAKRRGILRNAAVILGNQRYEPGVPSLAIGLVDKEEIVRGASAWALGQIGTAAAIGVLGKRLPVEIDEDVQQEIRNALRSSQR